MESETRAVVIHHTCKVVELPETDETHFKQESVVRVGEDGAQRTGWVFIALKTTCEKEGFVSFPTSLELDVDYSQTVRVLAGFGNKLYQIDLSQTKAQEVEVSFCDKIISIKRWGSFHVVAAEGSSVKVLRDYQVVHKTVNLLSGSTIDSVQVSTEYVYFKNQNSKLVRLDREYGEVIVEEDDQHYTGFVPERGSEITWINADGFMKRNNQEIFQVPASGLGRQLYKTLEGHYLACFGDNVEQGIWLIDNSLKYKCSWGYKGSLPPIEHLYQMKGSGDINHILVQTNYRWYLIRQSPDNLRQVQEIKVPGEVTSAGLYSNRLLLSGPSMLLDAELSLHNDQNV